LPTLPLSYASCAVILLVLLSSKSQLPTQAEIGETLLV